MSIDPVALLRHYHAALQPYDAAMAAACFAPGAVYVSPGVNGKIEGRDAIIASFNAYFAQPVTGVLVMLAATGQRIVRHGVETVQFDAAGLIIAVEVEDL